MHETSFVNEWGMYSLFALLFFYSRRVDTPGLDAQGSAKDSNGNDGGTFASRESDE